MARRRDWTNDLALALAGGGLAGLLSLIPARSWWPEWGLAVAAGVWVVAGTVLFVLQSREL